MHIGCVPRERPPFSALNFRSGTYNFHKLPRNPFRSITILHFLADFAVPEAIIFKMSLISTRSSPPTAGVTGDMVPCGYGSRNLTRQADRVPTLGSCTEVTGGCCANWRFSFQLPSFVFAYVYALRLGRRVLCTIRSQVFRLASVASPVFPSLYFLQNYFLPGILRGEWLEPLVCIKWG